MIRDSIGKGAFLNLFSYTGTASVMAAAGGASRVVNVDVSRTYLNWARDNMRLNRLESDQHSYRRMDALSFLTQDKENFDFIFIDPPTYSNGSGRPDWSVQDGHSRIIDLAMQRLRPEGTVIFSANYKRFVLNRELKKRYRVREITSETTDPDFVTSHHSHYSWELRHPL